MAKHIVKCLVCGQEFDASVEKFQKKGARYIHLACFEKIEEIENNPDLRICYYCKLPVDIKNEEYGKPVINRYAHKKCFEANYTEDMQYIDKLYSVLTRVHMKYDFEVCERQRNKYIKENGYSNEGIYKALEYWYEIQKQDISKAHGNIGIVPYIYNDAQHYFEELKKKQNQIKRVINKQAKDIKPVVNITAAEQKKKRTLIDLDSLEGEEDGR